MIDQHFVRFHIIRKIHENIGMYRIYYKDKWKEGMECLLCHSNWIFKE
jgi:hypothetical protein